MNIRDIDPQYVKDHGGHYNRCGVRDRQGRTRELKGGYRPLHQRARHDEPQGGGKR